MAEWDRTDVSLLTTKISHLTGTAGGRNGTYDLTHTTVATDTSSSLSLYGGNPAPTVIASSGKNWFIASSLTQVMDINDISPANDQFNTLSS